MPSSLSGRTLRGAIGWGTQAQGVRARSAQGGCWGAQSVREIGRCAAWAAAGGGRARRPALTPVDWPSSGGASLRRSGSCGRCHPFGSVERERSFELPPPVRRALAALPAVRLGRLQSAAKVASHCLCSSSGRGQASLRPPPLRSLRSLPNLCGVPRHGFCWLAILAAARADRQAAVTRTAPATP